MTSQGRAYLHALLAVLLWSTVASAFKIALLRVDVFQLLFYATATSTAVLGAILLARRRLGDVLAVGRSGALRSIGLGLLNPFLYYLVLFAAYDRLPAQVAQPLNYTWAIALALLSIPLLGQKIGRRDIVAGVVSYAGAWVISTGGAPAEGRLADPLGVGLALGSAFLWALYWIANTRDRLDAVARLFLNFLFGLPFVLATCLVFSDLRIGGLALLSTVYVGTVEMGVAFVLWLTALRLSRNTARVGNLIFLSPFLSLVFIHSLVGEDIRPATYVGLVMIVAGLLYQRLGSRPDASDEPTGG